MIDLSALGLSSVQTPHAGGKRDKASHDTGKDAKNFGDFVNAAGRNGKRNSANDDAATLETGKAPTVDALATADDAALLAEGDQVDSENATDDATAPRSEKFANAGDARGIDAKGGRARDTGLVGRDAAAMDEPEETEAGGALNDVDAFDRVDAFNDGSLATEQSTPAEGRVRLSAGFQQLMKSSAESGVLRRAEAAQNEVKAEKLEVKPEQSTQKDDVAAVKKKPAASPSEELQALLGMTPAAEERDGETAGISAEKPAKTSKHLADDDNAADAKPAKADNNDAAVVAGMKADIPAAQAAVVQHAAAKIADDATVSADADDGRLAGGNADKVQLVSDDGKSRPVEIELTKLGKDDNAEPQLNGKTDFVTVLDSRRYLGFSTDGNNAAALTSAIKAEPSWAQVIQNVNTGAQHTATEVNTLKLQMNPEHLGNMTASLRLKGDELSVEVRVETVDAYRQLSNDQDSIVKALKDQGFSIDQVSIQLSPSARADASQGSTSQNSGNQSQSSSNGQNLQQGGQGDNARQRDESARRNQNQNNWMGNDPTSTFSDSGINSSSTDTGNLYL